MWNNVSKDFLAIASSFIFFKFVTFLTFCLFVLYYLYLCYSSNIIREKKANELVVNDITGQNISTQIHRYCFHNITPHRAIYSPTHYRAEQREPVIWHVFVSKPKLLIRQLCLSWCCQNAYWIGHFVLNQTLSATISFQLWVYSAAVCTQWSHLANYLFSPQGV